MPTPTEPLKIAIPNKGRLSEESLRLFERAGIRVDFSHERKLFATAHNGAIKMLFLRAADIAEFVADGVAHIGITGRDIVEETGAEVTEILDLGFGRCRLVMAVPEESAIRTIDDVPDKITVATSFPMLTRRYFESRDIEARIIPVSGATEITPHIGVADLITDLTSTGSTLAMNGLREVETILSSSACVFGAPGLLDGPDGERVREFLFAIESVMAAEKKRYLLADVPRSAVPEVRKILPGIAGPTVVDVVGDDDMVAIHVVVDDDGIYDAVAQLKRLGGRGILVMPIDRMVA